jgi:tetratricopeptide (TPR) repeat protein
VAAARRLKHRHTLCFALAFSAMLTMLCGQVEATIAQCQEVIELGKIESTPQFVALAYALRAWGKAALGQPNEAVADFAAARAQAEMIQANAMMGFMLSSFALILLQAEQLDGARECTQLAVAACKQNQDLAFYPFTLCTHTEVELACGAEWEEAHPRLEEAAAVAEQQQARSSALRVALACHRLATQYAGQAEVAQAHRQVAALYAQFTEGFETADLRAAKALLAY